MLNSDLGLGCRIAWSTWTRISHFSGFANVANTFYQQTDSNDMPNTAVRVQPQKPKIELLIYFLHPITNMSSLISVCTILWNSNSDNLQSCIKDVVALPSVLWEVFTAHGIKCWCHLVGWGIVSHVTIRQWLSLWLLWSAEQITEAEIRENILGLYGETILLSGDIH